MRAQDQRTGPHLTVSDTSEAIAFYTDVFDAVAIQRECLLDGHVVHAELAVGGHRLIVSEWWEAGDPSVAANRDEVLTIERTDPESVLRRAGRSRRCPGSGSAAAARRSARWPCRDRGP
ncbi:VOC family protein, partial [Micromonospora chalcea]